MFLKKQLCFTSDIEYLQLRDFYNKTYLLNDLTKYTCLAVSGIAKPYYFNHFLKSKFKNVKNINFSDHHVYNKNDINDILHIYNTISEKNKVIVTTEKDYVKLNSKAFANKFINIPICFLPISFKFANDKKLSEIIFNYVK